MRAKVVWFVMILVIAVTGMACNPRYSATDIGTLGGTGFTRAEDINASGRITGLSRINDTVHHAFLWNNGLPMTDLGSFATTALSNGLGINDAGIVVGVASAGLDSMTSAQAWTPSARVTLPTLGGLEAVATAINNYNIIAGASDLEGNTDFHAVVWNGASATPQDLGSLGGPWSLAQDINESGQVVGWSLLSADDVPGASKESLADLLSGLPQGEKRVGSFPFPSKMHAFLWDGSGPMQDLGTLDAQGSIATAINASGQIVGMSYIPGNGRKHAVFWDSNGIRDLGTLGGTEACALDINAAGQVVGYSQTASGEKHAFLYNGSNLIDLNSLLWLDSAGWVLEEAVAINDNGQIAGNGTFNGVASSFLLDPVSPGEIL